MVDPEKQMEELYNLMLGAQEAAIAALVKDAPLRCARSAAVSHFQSHDHSELAEKIPKAVGFGMGIEIRDTALILNDSNETLAKPGMIFYVCMSLPDMRWPTPGDKREIYAFLIADTVAVQDNGKPPEVLTAGCPKSWSHVAYFLHDVSMYSVFCMVFWSETGAEVGITWVVYAYFECWQGEEDVRQEPEPPRVREELLDPRGRHSRTEIPNYNNKEQQR